MNEHPSHAEIEELLGAYALDAVEPDERDLLDQHLPTCARCRAEVQEDREAAALLAHSGAPAPEGVWERIVESLEVPPPRLDLVPRSPADPGQGRPRTWVTRTMVGALAVAAATIAFLGFEVRDQGDQLDAVRAAMQERGVEAGLVAAAGDPDARRVELTSADGEIEGVRAVLLPDGAGYLLSASLPALAEGRTYQLWGDTGDELLSLGVLGGDPADVVALAGWEGVQALAITEESFPGVVESEQPPVATGVVTS